MKILKSIYEFLFAKTKTDNAEEFMRYYFRKERRKKFFELTTMVSS